MKNPKSLEEAFEMITKEMLEVFGKKIEYSEII